jgi:hypothetical protein
VYYPKWVPFVTGFTFADVVNAIPQQHREKYVSILLGSQVQLHERFSSIRQGTTFVSAAGVVSWQKKRRACNDPKGFVYTTESVKTIGSGRKLKYPEEEEFIRNAISKAWETGNPLSRVRCYDLLASKFGLQTMRPWTKQMDIGTGFISNSPSQWLMRPLDRLGYSVRKEPIYVVSYKRLSESW